MRYPEQMSLQTESGQMNSMAGPTAAPPEAAIAGSGPLADIVCSQLKKLPIPIPAAVHSLCPVAVQTVGQMLGLPL